jgi:hypothetical protein
MHLSRSFAALGSLVVLAGCADAVGRTDRDGSMGGDAIADSPPADRVPIVDTSVWTTDVPADTPEVPPDASLRCGHENAGSVGLSAVLHDGTQLSCSVQADPSQRTARELDGAITEVHADGFTVDSCPPNADCVGFFNHFTASAPGLSLAGLRVGAFVHIVMDVSRPWGCSTYLAVTNLPSWGGEQNPADNSTDLYLAASDGDTSAEPNTQLRIDRVPLHCVADAGAGCGGGPADDFALRFTLAGAGAPLTLGMGQAAELPPGAAASARYRASDLRSYESGYCDDYWNWAWFVVREP